MEMTKQEYLDIRNNPVLDVIPVLHYYHNYACKSGEEMNLSEFRLNYGKWLHNPIIQMAQAKIITAVFTKMDRIMDIYG